jgi:hypothetical protein
LPPPAPASQIPRRAESFARAVIIALTTWALGTIVPDLYRVVVPLASAGFAADNDGRVYDVVGPFGREANSPAWQAGLRVGDQLDLQAMRCLPPRGSACRDLIAVVGGMGGTQLVRPGRVLQLTVEPNRVLTIRSERPYRAWFSRFVLLLQEITGIAFIVAATWLAWTRPGPMTVGFWLYSLWFNPGQNFVFYLLMQEHPRLELAQECLSALVHGAACAGFVLFALRVPDDRPDPRWQLAERAVPIVGIVIAAMQLVSYANILGFETEGVSRATFYADYIVDALVVGILLRRRHGRLPQDYQRLRWVIWGCAIGLPAYILSGLLQSTSLWYELSGSTAVPHTLIGLLLVVYGALGWFVFEAVRRPRVVTVSIPLRRITVFGLILSVPTLFAHQETEHLRALLHLPEWAWIAFAALLLFLLGRLHELSAELADHVFNRSFHRRTEELATISGEILKADTADAIDRLLSKAPHDTLGLASATVFRSDNGEFRRHIDGLGWPPGSANTLNANEIAATPFHVKHSDAERLCFPTGLATPTFAVPVRDKLTCFAVAFYGPHVSGADLATDEHTMLASLASDAALAYAHAETDALRRQVAALERRLDELPR